MKAKLGVAKDNNIAVGIPHHTTSNLLYSDASAIFKYFSSSFIGLLQAQSI
jgi:hypothetical protein